MNNVSNLSFYMKHAYTTHYLHMPMYLSDQLVRQNDIINFLYTNALDKKVSHNSKCVFYIITLYLFRVANFSWSQEGNLLGKFNTFKQIGDIFRGMFERYWSFVTEKYQSQLPGIRINEFQSKSPFQKVICHFCSFVINRKKTS